MGGADAIGQARRARRARGLSDAAAGLEPSGAARVARQASLLRERAVWADFFGTAHWPKRIAGAS